MGIRGSASLEGQLAAHKKQLSKAGLQSCRSRSSTVHTSTQVCLLFSVSSCPGRRSPLPRRGQGRPRPRHQLRMRLPKTPRSGWQSWARFPCLALSKLRLCSTNHRPGYFSNLPCDWPSTAWAYSWVRDRKRAQVQAEVHAPPAGAACLDPDPTADAGPVAPGESEAAADGQYILFYSFQSIFVCKCCYFQISNLNINLEKKIRSMSLIKFIFHVPVLPLLPPLLPLPLIPPLLPTLRPQWSLEKSDPNPCGGRNTPCGRSEASYSSPPSCSGQGGRASARRQGPWTWTGPGQWEGCPQDPQEGLEPWICCRGGCSRVAEGQLLPLDAQ